MTKGKMKNLGYLEAMRGARRAHGKGSRELLF